MLRTGDARWLRQQDRHQVAISRGVQNPVKVTSSVAETSALVKRLCSGMVQVTVFSTGASFPTMALNVREGRRGLLADVRAFSGLPHERRHLRVSGCPRPRSSSHCVVRDLLSEQYRLHVGGAVVEARPDASLDDLVDRLREAAERTRRWPGLERPPEVEVVLAAPDRARGRAGVGHRRRRRGRRTSAVRSSLAGRSDAPSLGLR
jgi:hypothetical protein